MKNGTLDAAEWIGPYDDYRLGLHTLNAIYYEPGWQEPNTMFEFLINRTAYDALSADIKAKLYCLYFCQYVYTQLHLLLQ